MTLHIQVLKLPKVLEFYKLKYFQLGIIWINICCNFNHDSRDELEVIKSVNISNNHDQTLRYSKVSSSLCVYLLKCYIWCCTMKFHCSIIPEMIVMCTYLIWNISFPQLSRMVVSTRCNIASVQLSVCVGEFMWPLEFMSVQHQGYFS